MTGGRTPILLLLFFCFVADRSVSTCSALLLRRPKPIRRQRRKCSLHDGRGSCLSRINIQNDTCLSVVQKPSLAESNRDEQGRWAYPQQTPHSGRHFFPSHPAQRGSWWRTALFRRRGRFMEGWYYRLTIVNDDYPQESASFAFIVSIEDAGRRPPSPIRLSCIQVVGPHDEYLIQADRDDSLFWAWKKQQGLGCTFSCKHGVDAETVKRKMALDRDMWLETVESGFQILPNHLIGRVRGHDGSNGILTGEGVPGECDFDFTIEPICGWGGTRRDEQKSTGGWLSSYAVFEPHWQVTLADARATGYVRWKGRTYSFADAPFYAEKNWGAALPPKWFWTQCNSFTGYKHELTVTAGGGIRKIPLGQTETLGMLCIHYGGVFYEAVPWTGAMSWSVATWGSWKMHGNSTIGDHPFEAEIEFSCNPETTPGLVFRAPTPDQGMVRFCRDTFEADVTLSVWELEFDRVEKRYRRKQGPPLIDRASSKQGGAEIGGGPWWDTWRVDSKVKQPIKALLRLPFQLERIQKRIYRRFK